MTFKDDNKLQELAKLKMNYTEQIISCQNCKHSSYSEHQLQCKFTNICVFDVLPYGHCDFFAQKPLKPLDF